MLKSKSVLGIEVIFQSSEKYSINIVSLQKKKNEIHTVFIKEGIESVSVIEEFAKNDVPVILIVKGKGILTKKIETQKGVSDSAIVSELLPNATKDDFFTQISPLGNGYSYASIIRKNSLKIIVNLFQKEHVNIFDIGVGNQYLLSLISLVSINSDFVAGEEKYIIKDGIVENIENSKLENGHNSILIGDESISSEAINAYAAAFSYFFNTTQNVSISDTYNPLREDTIFKNLNKKVGLIFLGFFFLTLSVNYLIFSHYSKITNQQHTVVNLNNGIMWKIDSLKLEIVQKERLVKESGFLYTLSHAYMADRLAYIKPTSMTLSLLNIQELDGEYSEDEKFIFKHGIIKISGKTDQSIHINNWINAIKKEGWVEEVELEEYNYNMKENIGVFKITVKLR